jgi:hypothetical protein
LHDVLGIQTPPIESHSGLYVCTHCTAAVPCWRQQAPLGHGVFAHVPPGVKMYPGAGQLAAVALKQIPVVT